MWIDKALYEDLKARAHDERVAAGNWQADYAAANAKANRLEVELMQQRTLNEWFRHRLTQVEQERAQLIYAATGGKEPVPQAAKIAAPNFNGQVPVENFATMAQMLNKGFNPFEGIGEDSQDPSEQLPEHVEDTSNMPTRR
jgi:hypothetical protein